MRSHHIFWGMYVFFSCCHLSYIKNVQCGMLCYYNNMFWHIYVSRTSPWGVPTTRWVQGGSRSDTRDLWCHRWEGPSDLTVGEGPGCWKRLPPTETRNHEGKHWVAYGVQILECSRSPQSEVWSTRYGNLSGALPRDNTQHSMGRCGGTIVAWEWHPRPPRLEQS